MAEQQLILDTGPFRVAVRSTDATLFDTLSYFYRGCERHDGPHFLDFDIRIRRVAGIRRLVRPQALFEIDGLHPFEPQPAENAFPSYEWGLNWCIATSAHRYLMLHAGTLALGGSAVVLPGHPGSGKSTLTAALCLRGARLLSDEFGLLRPESLELLPMPRGIPLKNASIEAIQEFDSAAPLGPIFPKTRKGRVRHLRPDAQSLSQQQVPATPRWLIFPKYRAGAVENLRSVDETEAFRHLAYNCFNYKLLGETGFRAVGQLVRQMDCYSFTFSRLDRAVDQIMALTAGDFSAAGVSG